MKTCDCENCPLSWEDRSYEGDCDCGCMAYGDYLGGAKFICRLPQFIKRKITKWKQRRIDKQQAHQYDGIVEWYTEEQRKNRAFRQAIEECIFVNRWGERLILCSEDKDGKRYKVEISDEYDLARMRYEELLKESEVTE